MTRRPFYIDVPDNVSDDDVKLLLREALWTFSTVTPNTTLVERHQRRLSWIPTMSESLRDRRALDAMPISEKTHPERGPDRLFADEAREIDKLNAEIAALPVPLDGTRLIPTFDAAGENDPGFVAVDSTPAPGTGPGLVCRACGGPASPSYSRATMYAVHRDTTVTFETCSTAPWGYLCATKQASCMGTPGCTQAEYDAAPKPWRT